jgi:predicted ATPase with chaperone activity
MKKWLETRIKELEINIHTVEDFVEQQSYYNFTNEHFQNVRDNIDMYSQTYNVMNEYTMTVKKEDTESLKESVVAITKLNGLIQKIETEQEGNKEKFKKELLQLIPKLDADINQLLEESINEKFLDGANMEDENKYKILEELNNIEERFKQLESLKDKYNNW